MEEINSLEFSTKDDQNTFFIKHKYEFYLKEGYPEEYSKNKAMEDYYSQSFEMTLKQKNIGTIDVGSFDMKMLQLFLMSIEPDDKSLLYAEINSANIGFFQVMIDELSSDSKMESFKLFETQVIFIRPLNGKVIVTNQGLLKKNELDNLLLDNVRTIDV